MLKEVPGIAPLMAFYRFLGTSRDFLWEKVISVNFRTNSHPYQVKWSQIVKIEIFLGRKNPFQSFVLEILLEQIQLQKALLKYLVAPGCKIFNSIL